VRCFPKWRLWGCKGWTASTFANPAGDWKGDSPCEFLRGDVQKLQTSVGGEMVETIHDFPALSFIILWGAGEGI